MVKYNVCIAMIAILMATKGDAATQSFPKKENPPYDEKILDRERGFIPVYKMKNSRAFHNDNDRLDETDAYTKEVTPQSFTDSDFPARNDRDEGPSPSGPSYGRNTEYTPFVGEDEPSNGRNTEITPFADEYYVAENFRRIHEKPHQSEDEPQRRTSHDFGHDDSDTLLEDRNIESQMRMENPQKRYEENFDSYQRKYRDSRLPTDDFGTFLETETSTVHQSDHSKTEEYQSDFDSVDEHNFIPVSKQGENKEAKSLVPAVVSSPSVASTPVVAVASTPVVADKTIDKATAETLEGVKDLYS